MSKSPRIKLTKIPIDDSVVFSSEFGDNNVYKCNKIIAYYDGFDVCFLYFFVDDTHFVAVLDKKNRYNSTYSYDEFHDVLWGDVYQDVVDVIENTMLKLHSDIRNK